MKLYHTSILTIPVSFIKNVEKIKKVLNKFLSFYEWFIGNKLSIHFGDDKKQFFSFTKIRSTTAVDPQHLKVKE